MSAIWGIYHYNRNRRVTRNEMAVMDREIQNRKKGQLQIGIFGALGLGQRALKSHHCNEAEHLLSNEEGTLFLVCDGFITNYNELRKMLVKQGHRFSSHEDPAEVALHLFEEKQEDSFRMLNGMFALAIWNESEKRIILV